MFKKVFTKIPIEQYQKRYFQKIRIHESPNDKIIKTSLNLLSIYLKGVVLSTAIGGLYIYKTENQYNYYINPYNALFMSFLYASLPSVHWPILVPLKAIYCYDTYIKK